MEMRTLDRLGDEIAELSAHLDAATARLLELIRESDAREGWNTGFSSCAAWLARRDPHAPGEPGRARAESGVPAPAGVELSNEIKETSGRGVEVGR